MEPHLNSEEDEKYSSHLVKNSSKFPVRNEADMTAAVDEGKRQAAAAAAALASESDLGPRS